MFGKNRKKRVGLCVTVVTASLVLAGLWAFLATPETALAAKPAKPPGQDKDKPGGGGGGKYLHLDVSFRDDDGDRVKSDGGTYSDGEEKVIALADKRFRLDTTKKGGKRTVTLDFTDFDDSPFDQDQIEVAVDMRLGFKYTEDVAGDFLEELDVAGMSLDEVIQATMSIHFSYDGDLYGLAFGHIAQFIDEISENTGRPVTVTRAGPETWTIATSNYSDQAALYLIDWKNGHTYYGDSIMPFMVTLEVQP